MKDLKIEKINKENLNIIKKQLDREPEHLFGIANKCSKNKPQVIVTHPFSEEKGVFPTTFWLSCPFLVKEVSILEDKGLVKQLTNRLNNDKEFKIKLDKAHKMYAKKRLSLLDDKIKKKIKKISPDIMKVIKNSGIAGIREKEGIKCLHGHLADFLVNNFNPVGKIVFDKLPSSKLCNTNFCDTSSIKDERG